MIPAYLQQASAEYNLHKLESARREAREQAAQQLVPQYDNPADFIQKEMYIPETPGIPLQLDPEIYRVITKMFERKGDGSLRYTTMLYSSIKKSGKTTICAGIALWQAYRIPYGEIYIVGNDLKQADNRMNQAIRFCLAHNERMKEARVLRNTAYLPNGTKIEAVPVDASGEAGPNPTGIFWTEVWGAKQKRHEEMWSEMTLSPTRAGHAFKLLESYAGHSGESMILERLYNATVRDHKPINPDISPELFEEGSTIAYWNTRRYLPWQHGEAAEAYYTQEAREKLPAEFRRQHLNEWVGSEDVFVPPEWWDACGKEPFDGVRPGEPVILSADAGVTSDCFAVVMLTRRKEKVQVQYAKKWQPQDGALDYRPIETEIRGLVNTHNVIELCYDPFQLHDMMGRIRVEESVNTHAFNQASPRAIADKRLYDLIRDRRMQHRNESDLRAHILNANAKPDEDKLRLVKRTPEDKIDLAVATSMGADRSFAYALDE